MKLENVFFIPMTQKKCRYTKTNIHFSRFHHDSKIAYNYLMKSIKMFTVEGYMILFPVTYDIIYMLFKNQTYLERKFQRKYLQLNSLKLLPFLINVQQPKNDTIYILSTVNNSECVYYTLKSQRMDLIMFFILNRQFLMFIVPRKHRTVNKQ